MNEEPRDAEFEIIKEESKFWTILTNVITAVLVILIARWVVGLIRGH